MSALPKYDRSIGPGYPTDPIAEILAKLIEDQAEDEASPGVDPEPGISAATDLGLDLANVGDRDMTIGPRRRNLRKWVRVSWKAIAPEGTERWIVIRGLNPWGESDYPDDPDPETPCPVCGGAPLREAVYCARCDATGADGKADFPGIGPMLSLRTDCPRGYLIRPAYSAPGRGGLGGFMRRKRP